MKGGPTAVGQLVVHEGEYGHALGDAIGLFDQLRIAQSVLDQHPQQLARPPADFALGGPDVGVQRHGGLEVQQCKGIVEVRPGLLFGASPLGPHHVVQHRQVGHSRAHLPELLFRRGVIDDLKDPLAGPNVGDQLAVGGHLRVHQPAPDVRPIGIHPTPAPIRGGDGLGTHVQGDHKLPEERRVERPHGRWRLEPRRIVADTVEHAAGWLVLILQDAVDDAGLADDRVVDPHGHLAEDRGAIHPLHVFVLGPFAGDVEIAVFPQGFGLDPVQQPGDRVVVDAGGIHAPGRLVDVAEIGFPEDRPVRRDLAGEEPSALLQRKPHCPEQVQRIGNSPSHGSPREFVRGNRALDPHTTALILRQWTPPVKHFAPEAGGNRAARSRSAAALPGRVACLHSSSRRMTLNRRGGVASYSSGQNMPMPPPRVGARSAGIRTGSPVAARRASLGRLRAR